MGCILSIIGSVISHLLYFSEKFMYCFTCAALISCLVTTLFVTLGMGIGIGYNYCFVDFKTKHRFVPRKYYKYNPTPHWKRSVPANVTASGVTENENNLRTADNSTQVPIGNENETKSHSNINNTKLLHNIINSETTEHMHENKNQVTQTDQQTSTEKTTEDSSSLIIPIGGLDLIELLSKFRSENRNYSLQIVTT